MIPGVRKKNSKVIGLVSFILPKTSLSLVIQTHTVINTAHDKFENILVPSKLIKNPKNGIMIRLKIRYGLIFLGEIEMKDNTKNHIAP